MRSGFRTKTVTSCPLARASATTSFPVPPVAPITRSFTVGHLSMHSRDLAPARYTSPVPHGNRTAVIFYSILWIVYSGFVVCAATLPFRFTNDEQIILMKIAHVSPDPLADTWA